MSSWQRSSRIEVTTPSSLQADSARLGVELDAAAAAKLLMLAAELAEWNRKFNLTSIDDDRTVTHHLLDSLSLMPYLRGRRIADIGTGAGFPGLPLAIVEASRTGSERQFVLIDSTRKKLTFVEHMVAKLELSNVTTVHARAEQYRPPQLFDSVVARALAKLDQFVRFAGHLCAPDGRLLAMKGRVVEAEIQAIPRGWRILVTHRVAVPGLEAERHIIELGRVQSVRRNPV
jgi:16S rRNA (guanine527-N7)-methyltransferase